MNAILTYWITGCILVGGIIGAMTGRCPHDKVKNSDVLLIIAAWPATIAGAVAYHYAKAESTPFTCGVME